MKNNFRKDSKKIVVLVLLAALIFPLAFSEKNIIYLNKFSKNSNSKNVSNYSYYDDYYNEYGYYENDSYYDYNNDYYYQNNDYNNDYYNYDYNYNNNDGYYNEYGYYENDSYYDYNNDYYNYDYNYNSNDGYYNEYGYYENDTYNDYNYDNGYYNEYGYYENDSYYDNYYYGYDDDNYTNYDYYYDTYNEDGYYNSIKTYSNNNRYNSTDAPSITITKSQTIYVGDTYNVMSKVSANHSYYGDVTDEIEVIYNNLIGNEKSTNFIKVTTPGEYQIVYRACSYPGSNYCRTATRKVTVKEGNSSSSSYSKGPKWKNTDDYECSSRSNSCDTYSIPEPTATDPYSGRKLNVRLVSGEINSNDSGTYTLIYEAYTEHNVRGITTKNVKVSYNGGYNSDTTLPRSKYISNYYTDYYEDDFYSGRLTLDRDNNNYNFNYNNNEKFIDNYEWTNKVKYTYECTNVGESGTDGWTYISTDTSDNHPTIEYSKSGYSGTLMKKDFYCKKGCDDKLISELGTCNTKGQTKQISRTWVGIYYGSVYSSRYNSYYNQEETYSGYVYLKR